MRPSRLALLAAALLALAGGAATAAPPAAETRAVGLPWHGRLVAGVTLPAEGDAFFTWDSIRRVAPNRDWRRTGTRRLVATLLDVAAAYRAAHPEAARIGIGDLSRPQGGEFGERFGAPGHASHQNGLDADVYYPRRDGRERPPGRPGQIDRRLAQELVDRFVAAGAVKVFVGPRTGLTGPPAIVEVLPQYHDNHLHVRLPGDGVASAELGTSTLGRSIRAFRVGRGHARVLVVGCVHGDECAGSVIATRLLHARPPADGSLWVVPDLNPDGHAAKRRTNARGVDLNRNFPGTWRDLAASGSAPASEVETRLAMRLIREAAARRDDLVPSAAGPRPGDLSQRRRRARVRSARPDAVPRAPAAARLCDRLAARGAARDARVRRRAPAGRARDPRGRPLDARRPRARRPLVGDAHGDLAALGARRQEAEETASLCLDRSRRTAREPLGERHRERDRACLRPLEPPDRRRRRRRGGPSRGRCASFGRARDAVARGTPCSLGVREQQVVVLGQEPDGRGRLRIGPRRVGQVEQLAAVLVAECPQAGRRRSTTSRSPVSRHHASRRRPSPARRRRGTAARRRRATAGARGAGRATTRRSRA